MPNSVPCELPRQKACGGHHDRLGLGRGKPLKLLIEEEEGLVLANWTSHGVAKLVADVWVLRATIGSSLRIEPVPRATDFVVAPEPIRVEVNFVGSAFGHDIDDGTG